MHICVLCASIAHEGKKGASDALGLESNVGTNHLVYAWCQNEGPLGG